MGPVVVFLAVGAGELAPPLLRVFPLRLEQGPQGGAVDHHAVVEVGDVARVDGARRGLAVRRRRAALGALLDGGDEVVQLLEPLADLAEALLGSLGGFLVGAVAGGAQVGLLAFERALGRVQMTGQQVIQRAGGPSMDGHVRDERAPGRAEREVDGPVLVHLAMHVGEELVLQVVLERPLVIDRRAMRGPGRDDRRRGRMREAVVVAGVGQEQDAVGQRRRGRVTEDAFAVGAEAPERDADGEGEMIGGRLGIVDGLVGRQRRALGAIDCELGPVLGVGPLRSTRQLELNGSFPTSFVLAERSRDRRNDLAGLALRQHRHSLNVAYSESDRGIQVADHSASESAVHSGDKGSELVVNYRPAHRIKHTAKAVEPRSERVSHRSKSNPSLHLYEGVSEDGRREVL